MKRRNIGAALALWAGSLAMTGQASAASVCLDENEAQSLMTVLLPDLLNALGKTCETSLPPNAILRSGRAALVAKYRVESDIAWADAKGVIGKIGGDDLKDVDPELLRPLVGAMITPMIAKKVKPQDCVTFDRAIGLLAPLPPRNTAGLIVLFYQLGTEGKDKKPPFTICPAQ